MKKQRMIWFALLLAVAVAMPASAVEFKYGGMYRLRLQSKDNVADGQDKKGGEFDDNGNWIDQRLRLFFDFVASERLELVTKWEVDTQWGDGKTFFDNGIFRQLKGSGGGVGADAVNYEMKNVYIDFAIPYTPTRARLGVQGIIHMYGWVVDDDFSAVRLITPIEPVTVDVGYIAASNEDVTSSEDDIDDWFLNIEYSQGPFSAGLTLFYQYGHDTGVSTIQTDPTFRGVFEVIGIEGDVAFKNNKLFDLGISLGYKADWMAAKLNFVKNFGDYEWFGVSEDRTIRVAEKVDYDGWMIEAGTDFLAGDFTFTLGGFFTTGSNFDELDKTPFRYPLGRSHYWSEILGFGTLDVNVGGVNQTDHIFRSNGGYSAGEDPSNLWTIMAGTAWQALRKTSLTLNYYYVGTHKGVISDFFLDSDVPDETFINTSKSIGHEVDFYLDQDIFDGLTLRLVGAYLFAKDGYTVLPNDDDAYEVGAQLLLTF
jgi:hypothetical protein